ncbi:MAG TPA: neutral zinc metallopeptidase [Burkholderiaceae bacterium]|nr:neutral zinc metallopeptidase [Burkholderiaceae bacterium]
MRLDGERESDNVEDMRAGRGGGRGFPLGGGRGIGLGTVAIALVAGWIFGINPLTILGALSGGGAVMQPTEQQAPAQPASSDEPMVRFVKQVLGSTEDVWTVQFQQAGAAYQAPKLALFRGSVPTACGRGQSAMGPFYCPGDHKVYLDLDFYEVMKTRLGAPGDFAQAYVIAHEVGHHVQNLMGVTGKVDAMRGRVSEAQQNALSVRLELQADCLAGVWAHHADATRQILEQGDVEEALNAASQIGDDALQRKSQGTVVPESFTHGTSAQRVAWFKRGLQTGSVQQCNTFEAGKV